MRGREGVCELAADEPAMERMGRALHDLCQPLTALQCRLELAELADSAEAYREAVELGLAECGRMAGVVGKMREILCLDAGASGAEP